jgi:hypothetical protein
MCLKLPREKKFTVTNGAVERLGFPEIGNSIFFKNNHPLILELACGKGEYTLALATRIRITISSALISKEREFG